MEFPRDVAVPIDQSFNRNRRSVASTTAEIHGKPFNNTMYVCMHACLHACVYVCVYTYIYRDMPQTGPETVGIALLRHSSDHDPSSEGSPNG